MKAELSLSPRKLFRGLLVCILAIVTISTIAEIVKYRVGITPTNTYYFQATSRVLYVDSEQSVGTLFSTLQLAAAAMLLAIITRQNWQSRGYRSGRWMLLTIIFVAMTVDEACSIHELTIRGMAGLRNYFTSGYFFYTWVLLGIVFVVAFALLYIPFLFRLPRRTARDFVIGGALFVAGAVGMEMIGGNYTQLYGRQTLGFVALATIEETLEMVGIAVFVKALLEYLQLNHRVLTVRVGEPGGSSDSAPVAVLTTADSATSTR